MFPKHLTEEVSKVHQCQIPATSAVSFDSELFKKLIKVCLRFDKVAISKGLPANLPQSLSSLLSMQSVNNKKHRS